LVEDSLSVLDNLKDLRWISFPFKLSQENLKIFIKKHPELEVVTLPSGASIKDFNSLKELKNLKALAVIDTLADYKTLLNLKQLQYLSVPMKFSKDNEKMEELKKALPNCKIVISEGFCLGSGWFLLIIPFIGLMFVIFSFKFYGKQN
jgi:hypothetical protein